MTTDTISRYSQGATKELLEKLRWHLSGIDSCSVSLSVLGCEVSLASATSTGVPLVILNGGKSLAKQLVVSPPKRTRTPPT